MIKFKYYIILIVLISHIQLNATDKFEYSGFDSLLNQYVLKKTVDYRSFMNDKEKLSEFTDQLAKKSPDSHSELFATKNDKLAYWINAYNAYILETILENYPVESIKDINFIGVTIWWNKNILGGEKISFKSLEDDIIRDRFEDPRIHFAINCASVSCPPLINQAFIPEKLEEQLEQNTKLFINDVENFKVDERNKTIHISAIFDWYEEDFTEWLMIEYPNINKPTILDYIKLYYNENFNQGWYNYKIELNDYDWSLNEAVN